MKLKRVEAICKKAKCYRLYDHIGADGEIMQWLGDSSALYLLEGLPPLDKASLCFMFDITSKQRENIFMTHGELPSGYNVEDTAPDERQLKDDDFYITFSGMELQPFRTSKGIEFVQRKYFAPLEDVMDMVRFFERVTPDGDSYIVAKNGMLIAAVIMPYKVISESFVDMLENVTRECRRALDAQRSDLKG